MSGEIAKAALTGAVAGSAVGPVGTAVGAGVGLLAGYLGSRKTKGEKELEAANAAEAARIASEQKRLSGGEGGMSASKLAAARGAIRGQTASAANEQIAAAMRGSSMDSGASGLQAERVDAINEGATRAVAQGDSSIRAQDLDYAQQQRDALQAQKQQLFQNQITTTEWQKQRKAQMAAALGASGSMAAGIPAPAVPAGAGQAYTNQATQFTPVTELFAKKVP